MTQTRIIETDTPAAALPSILSEAASGGSIGPVFILTDTTVAGLYLQQVAEAVPGARVCILPAGEVHKNINSLTQVWQFLSENGATRSSVLINLGGGTITDLGGFAAATFKRGIRTINIPTTLLGAADASLGGKTGINFNGLKNEIGAFHNPMAVILSTTFFHSLPATEILSGWAEVVKMAMITPNLPIPIDEVLTLDPLELSPAVSTMLKVAVESKLHITTEDPHEHGIRAYLNFGHTAAHAFESLAMHRSENGYGIPHGIAVAHGILFALSLSGNEELAGKYTDFLSRNYPPLPFAAEDASELTALMTHDKKNLNSAAIRFITLPTQGAPAITTFDPQQIAPQLATLLK